MREAIAWALIHSLWQGALIAVVLGAALGFVQSSRLRYCLACTSLVLLPGTFLITILRLISTAADHLRLEQATGASAWRVVSGLMQAPNQPFLSGVIPWLTPLWLSGVCILCLCHLAGWIELNRLQRRGVCSTSEKWQQKLRELSTILKLRKPVKLLESSLAETPMVLGHLRPVILMPVGLLTGLPVSHLEAILLHELAHICRNDYLVNCLQRAAESLFFYHPAVWWISRVIRTERENCCDDVVVSLSGDAYSYAVALASLEQTRHGELEFALTATGGNLMNRIRRLLYPQYARTAWTPIATAVLLIAAATTVFAAWHNNGTQPQSNNESFYTKWLNADVVYIINDQEKAAFLRLSTDAERQHFVEQFWLRRDPTPGTPANEFKDEHYRRIAYADQHWQTTSGKPGWQTDRGHIYILYGPPDEIDSHPKHGFEDWLYTHINGKGDNIPFRFVDSTGDRDYKLTQLGVPAR